MRRGIAFLFPLFVACAGRVAAETPDRFADERACTYRMPTPSGELRSETRPLGVMGRFVVRVNGRAMDVSARGLDLEELSREWTTCDAWRYFDRDPLVGKPLPRLVPAGGRALGPAPGAKLTFVYLFTGG